jgi:hypothetical protein
MGTEEMRVRADSDLVQFVRNFALKYKPLFRNGLFSYHIPPSEIPEIDFPYDAIIEIRIKQK